MRRRDFMIVFGGAMAARPFPIRAQQAAATRFDHALADMKRAYAKMAHPDEAARADYISRLVRLREDVVRRKADTWKAIDAEVRQHPAPADSDSKTLSGLIVGKWESPRHDYLYRADGTWTMYPVEEGITHGDWRIEGNQYFDSAAADPQQTSQYTIILISKSDFVFADQAYVFYETRLK